MSSKIKIKIGSVEVEFEGSEEFLKDELLKLTSSVLELYRESGLVAGEGETFEPSLEEKEKNALKVGKIQGTTGTIASKLNCTAGKCLIIAACAHLTFVAHHQSFTRKEILDKMKTAKNHFKTSYRDNLTSYLNTLINEGKLNEISTDTYALREPVRKELEQKLATK